MASGFLVIIGLILELCGAIIATLDKIPILNKITGQICSFNHIDIGLKKLDPENYDIPLTDRTLDKSNKGFKEIMDIINKRFGPYDKEFDKMYFDYILKSKTIETSICVLILAKYDVHGRKDCEIQPTTRRDLLLRIDVWKERYLIVRGFFLVFLGTLTIIKYFRLGECSLGLKIARAHISLETNFFG